MVGGMLALARVDANLFLGRSDGATDSVGHDRQTLLKKSVCANSRAQLGLFRTIPRICANCAETFRLSPKADIVMNLTAAPRVTRTR